ncbi:alpha/beta hydrolase [Mariniflexile gromovii]|uniref:Alpha/beta hydrolase n=1 Tax=Mariniflexile gromovii TaxID=362523 RepID=A0ABS4BUM5_9FLAO|nr:alpha/beta hydrolase [Mariniflexile gromovii]MBP0904295.1 alpha/beta hydrolase [Mariniflexile gromovii]
MDFQPLKYIYQSAGNPEASTLLLLHGTGGNENDLIPLAKNFGNNFNILSVRGNVLEQGMPRFFRRLGLGVFDEKDLQFRTHELVSFLKIIAPKEGFDLSKLIALGYSNGANIAGSILLLYPDLLSGAIMFRPMSPYKVLPTCKTEHGTPIFMSSGLHDGMVSPEEIKAYKDTLTKNNFNVELNYLNTGHNLIQDDISMAHDWLKTTF